MKRQYTSKELINHRYKHAVKKLEEELEKDGIFILSKEDAPSWYICVISKEDTDIGERPDRTTKSAYFVNPLHYERAREFAESL